MTRGRIHLFTLPLALMIIVGMIWGHIVLTGMLEEKVLATKHTAQTVTQRLEEGRDADRQEGETGLPDRFEMLRRDWNMGPDLLQEGLTKAILEEPLPVEPQPPER